jgi:hypothetical protein
MAADNGDWPKPFAETPATVATAQWLHGLARSRIFGLTGGFTSPRSPRQGELTIMTEIPPDLACRTGGRKPKMTPELINKAQRMYDSRTFTMAEIAASCAVTPMTIYRNIRTDSVRPASAPASTRNRSANLLTATGGAARTSSGTNPSQGNVHS